MVKWTFRSKGWLIGYFSTLVSLTDVRFMYITLELFDKKTFVGFHKKYFKRPMSVLEGTNSKEKSLGGGVLTI